MSINWPDLKFPPINLWSYPKMQRNFIRINDIIVPLDNVRYINRDGNRIVIALADQYKSEIEFPTEIAATEFFNELESRLVIDVTSLYDEDWEF